MTERALAVVADAIDTRPLREHWAWLVPAEHTPLLVGAFGDCIFGAPGGSHWALSLLEGDYRRVARDSAEFNALKQEPAYPQDWFNAEWVVIAAGNGLVPREQECLGWNIHPIIGGEFTVTNIGIYSVRVYHTVVGQLMGQALGRK